MERNKKVILSLLTLTSYVIVGVQWAQASVSSSSCSSGKYLNGSSGFFSSPNFPNNYPQNSICTWNITVPSGYIIKISFLHFELDPSLRDRVTITNVASSGGTLYGQSLPDPVYSVGNSIQVTFTSVTNQSSGFNASYTAVSYESVCPNLMTLNDTSGVITSPFYPRPYSVNQTCSWKITASKGCRVTLIIEKLNIQACGVFCTCDYLEIQNAFFSGDGSPRKRLCGLRNNYVVYYSFNESLKVLFVSDGNADDWYRGFKATYTQVNYTGLPAACTSGEFLNGSSGFFSSPNFPNNFPQYSRCTWNITVPSGYIMKINFLHFQLGLQWSGAWLTITNVTSGGDKLDGFSLPSPLYSVGNSIQVVFTSLTNQYSGFNASYTAVNYESVCPNPMTLNDASGVITSPFYPSSYLISQTCSWQITASKGKRVKLVIEVLNVQPCGASCSCGYLEIQNGSFSGDGAPKGRMCGRLNDYVVYYSFRENLKVLFVSDNTNKYSDQVFKATYTQVDYTGLPVACTSGQFLTESSGFFSSPNFPNNYSQYSICAWNITVPSGYIIKINFLHFQLGYKWRGGAQLTITNVASSSVVKLDGLYIPSPVYSVGNSIQVTFTSVTNQNSGFNASYTSISECSNYRFLNESNRANTFGSGNLCDDTLSKGWYRFSGEAGNQMAESCVDLGQCGTHLPGWLNGSHPAVADGAVQRRVCFYDGFSCCAYLTYISVRNCEGFYIYQLKPVTRCNCRYCGIGTVPTKPWTPDPPTFSLLSFAETEAVVQLANRKTLSNGNTVRYFQIIVLQLQKGGTDLGIPADKKYRGIKRKYEDQEEGEPYITAEFSKDVSRTTFTVGDGKYYSQSGVTEAVAKYLNGKLKSNTQYAVFQRSFDEDGAYENEGFVLFTTRAKFPTAIVVSVVVVLLVLLILAGAFIVWRRTRHGSHDVTEDTKGSSRNLQHCSSQEVEMSGNTNPSVELT